MENLSTDADSLSLASSADGTDHELLECDRSVRVSTAVDDIHHRNREDIGVGAAEIPVERDLELSCSSLGNRERNTEDSVSTEVRLGRGAVELDHLLVDSPLLESIHSDDCGSNDIVDVLDSLENALAAVALGIAVAKLKSLVFTC